MLLPLLLNNVLEPTGDVLSANDVESATEVSVPSLGQVHVLLADDVESVSQVSVPALGGQWEEEPTGGWAFLNTYELQLKRRREEEQRRQELEEETERIEDQLDREIAQLLREQEAKDAKRAELERLRSLAKESANLEAARRYSERVAKALERTITEGSMRAAAQLDRELRKALAEEEEFLALAASLLLQ